MSDLSDMASNIRQMIELLKTENAQLKTKNAQLKTKIARLNKFREVLANLYGVQNGPPLEKYREDWEEIMSRACRLLYGKDRIVPPEQRDLT